ncbi:hypothetical protein [Halomicrococcus sp. SG-WS-1]|uniref:hypothetical protein n=1 Tax=Halomicrococcus sp. SG-WS-1 TaxID=3439057 RepID=UPI003F7925E3
MTKFDADSAFTDRATAGSLAFVPLESPAGLEIIDPIERHRFSLYTSTNGPPLQTACDTDRFRFPVDAATQIQTASITLPIGVCVYAHTATDGMVASIEPSGEASLPHDTYYLEIAGPVKTYIKVEDTVTIRADTETTEITFGDTTDVLVGARSHHEHPATTVTTTSDPEDMMAAVSTFGSALKTTSPERSYPTLRGHPPTVELGDQLSIPDHLERPETGIELVLPPEYRYLYVAAPLAYYLGADIVSGDRPLLRTTDGFEYSLEDGQDFDRHVERILKHVFTLDCLTRTEGYYSVPLAEYESVEPRVDVDFAHLYDQPLTEQLRHYLQIPFDVIESAVPTWQLTSHVTLTPDSIEMLPFLVDDLAVVQAPRADDIPQSAVQTEAVEDYFRTDEFTRSTSSRSSENVESYVQPDTADSLYQAWVGEDTPVGANKLLASAFENRLDREPTTGDIDITVVCNDADMADEQNAIDTIYGSRDDLPFTIQTFHSLSRSELTSVLSRETDFFHYIGHIDEGGFQCTDGLLDAGSIDSVAVDAFFLNACQSYTQGCHLIEAGAIGGVVTLSDVINSGAVRIGRTMARLLNSGFPLEAALDIAQDESIVGGQYLVVGDGSLPVTQSGGSVPNVVTIESADDPINFHLKTYPTDRHELGSVVIPKIDSIETYALSSSTIEDIDATRSELRSFLELTDVPVRFNSELRWSSDVVTEFN